MYSIDFIHSVIINGTSKFLRNIVGELSRVLHCCLLLQAIITPLRKAPQQAMNPLLILVATKESPETLLIELPRKELTPAPTPSHPPTHAVARSLTHSITHGNSHSFTHSHSLTYYALITHSLARPRFGCLCVARTLWPARFLCRNTPAVEPSVFNLPITHSPLKSYLSRL